MVLHHQMQNCCISIGFTTILHRAQQGLTTYPPTMPNIAFQKSLVFMFFQEFQCFQAKSLSQIVKKQLVFIYFLKIVLITFGEISQNR